MKKIKYKISEIFRSFQGEGLNKGLDCTFIRFYGCNLSCKFCDTKFNDYKEMTIESIMNYIHNLKSRNIIFTGGEPTIQNLEPLRKELGIEGYWIGIETNGLNQLPPYIYDYITVSPKKNHFPIQRDCNELRMVNDNLTFDYVLSIESKFKTVNNYISPMENNGKFNIQETINLIQELNNRIGSIKEWKLSIQMHKLINIK